MDYDRLREIVDRVNQQEEYFDEVRTIIATAEKLPARLGEVMSQTMGIQWHRGTEWALAPGARVPRRDKDRAKRQQWVCPNERYRLMYVGAGLWQNLEFFTEFEERTARSSSARTTCRSPRTVSPLRHARSAALSGQPLHGHVRADAHPGPGRRLGLWEAKPHRVDGGLSLGGWWGQRIINVALEENGIPVLDFPVDPVDADTWDDARCARW